MANLINDIKQSSAWLVIAFKELGINLNYSIESIKQLDILIDKEFSGGKPNIGGLFAEQLGSKIFALGSYVGETIIKNCKGANWDKDSDDEINIAIIGANGWMVWPMQRVINRIQEGNENNLYVYAHALHTEYLKNSKVTTKPKWKFW